MVMRIFAVVFVFTLFQNVAAKAANEPFKGYDIECGYPIVVERTNRLSQAHQDQNGNFVIILDPSLSEPRQAFHRRFLIAHECAHHRMKHTTRHGLVKRFTAQHGVRDQEMSADCWAAEMLTQAGMLPQVIDIADQFWRRGFVSPGGGYPSGIQRSNMIRHCARLAVAKMRLKMARLGHPAER